jgi:hypothetical protein
MSEGICVQLKRIVIMSMISFCSTTYTMETPPASAASDSAALACLADLENSALPPATLKQILEEQRALCMAQLAALRPGGNYPMDDLMCQLESAYFDVFAGVVASKASKKEEKH